MGVEGQGPAPEARCQDKEASLAVSHDGCGRCSTWWVEVVAESCEVWFVFSALYAPGGQLGVRTKCPRNYL